ncbi:glutamate 5-kinase, partial [Planktotalea sp.]|uniref:glutamate 5-kinase n=1 Tax=Planktotalea sp. TaxID=2029877 RepID=UPI003297C618
NENDTIATDEIRYGDNDRLAAQVAVTVGADTLVLMSDVDGLYTANPSIDPSATRLDVVDEITPEIEAMAGDPTSSLSKGGMKTKVMAAITATSSGCSMVVMEGSVLRPIQALEAGANCTWFTAQTDPHAARKAWIFAMKSMGSVRLDAGAVKALNSGNSLLPAGVSQVTGRFKRGDCIAIEDQDGHVLGYGLARYTSTEAKAIKGHRSNEIEAILGYAGRAALIHRDDMAIQ